MPLPSGTNVNSGPSLTSNRRSGRVTTNRFGATGGEETGRSWNRNTAAATSASSADTLHATRSRSRLLFMRPAAIARSGSVGRSAVDELRVKASSTSSRASPMSRSRRFDLSRGSGAGAADGFGRRRGQRGPVRLVFEHMPRACRVTVSPSKALRPVSISKSTQPNAQMSVRLSTGCPRACSGLM